MVTRSVAVRQLSPGIYEHDGSLHINVAEILQRNGLPDTQENRELCIAVLVDLAQERFPKAALIVKMPVTGEERRVR